MTMENNGFSQSAPPPPPQGQSRTINLHISAQDSQPDTEAAPYIGTDIPVDADAESALRPIPAYFSERFIAYIIDTLPFGALWYGSVYHSISSGAELAPALIAKWGLLWLALYWLYVTLFTAGGRATVGKLIMGLRVRSMDGDNLSLFHAGVRTFGYFISGGLFYLGFVLALFTGLALHDHMAGSYVERVRPRSALGSGVVILLSWAFFTGFFYMWIYGVFFRTSPEAKAQIEMAQKGLYGLARLEALHRDKYGYYPDSIARLAYLSGDPAKFKHDLLKIYRADGFVLTGNKDTFEISARALDLKGTRVTLSGPPDSVREYYKKKDYERYINQ